MMVIYDCGGDDGDDDMMVVVMVVATMVVMMVVVYDGDGYDDDYDGDDVDDDGDDYDVSLCIVLFPSPLGSQTFLGKLRDSEVCCIFYKVWLHGRRKQWLSTLLLPNQTEPIRESGARCASRPRQCLHH